MKKMVTDFKKKTLMLVIVFIGVSSSVLGQYFESPQIDTIPFKKVKPFLGGDFALQYQSLTHYSDSVQLIPLGVGFNLPTANLTVGASLAPGVEVVLESYLSARHHNEAWVKGGYLMIDKLPFIKSESVNKIMDFTTIKIGVMELNYGDAHFRRTDNASAIRNPFVGNYIMDGFTTAPAIEVYYRNNLGLFGMIGLSQASLKPAIVAYNATSKTYTSYYTEKELSTYWKGGYDKQITDDFRIRAMVSGFSGRHHSLSLYNGDRAGSRYYLIMNPKTLSPDNVDITKNPANTYFGPGTVKNLNSYMLSLFTKYKGIEVFGFFENADGRNTSEKAFNFTHYAVEGIFRFGKGEQFNFGGRYNHVNDQDDQAVNRIQGILGWNMTKNILLKLEYVEQKYDKFLVYKEAKAGFKGLMFEATISF
jgi:hypothetical protein